MPLRRLSQSSAVVDRLALWLATGVGIGMVAPAPGTLGGLWGIPLTLAVFAVPGQWGQLALIAALLAATVVICELALRSLEAASDPPQIVLDEIAALPIVFVGVPALNWQTLGAGFLFFRLFDIWKAGPVRAAEQLPRAWGVLADDAVAAVLAWGALQAALWLDNATSLAWFAPST